MNPNAVKNYSQENLESLDFNLPQPKQPFELSITETKFNQLVLPKRKQFSSV